MTSLKDIQSLIADIDSIVPKADARLPWSKSGNVSRERRILERVRSYLVSQQQQLLAASRESSISTTLAQQEIVQQIVQGVTQEINFLRADLMQPLQEDVEALRQQREALIQEIRQLEQKRRQIDSFNQHSTAQQQSISEFSQGLINRCTDTLMQQLAQILANFEAGVGNAESRVRSHEATHTHSAIAPAFPQESVEGMRQAPVTSEQLRQLQENSDRMLTTLEANQRAIFEALGRDLQAYQASLAQGLEKMYSLGTQSEMLFTALVNRLAQQLGREASTRFSSSVPLSDAPTQVQEAGISPTAPEMLLKSDAFTVPERAPQPNPTPKVQTSLEPPQTVEPLSREAESVEEDEINSNSITEQEAIFQTDNADTSQSVSPMLFGQSHSDAPELSPEDSFLENLNSQEDWELIEGLDSENLTFELDENDQIDTFIQLDINDQASPSSEAVKDTLSSSNEQDLDFLLSWLNERQQDTTDSDPGTVTQLNKSEVAAELNQSADRRRQEIDELYQSLFGADSLTDTANLIESDFPVEGESNVSESMQVSENVQAVEHDQSTNTDSVTPIPSQFEDVLFEGVSDPATEPLHTQPPVETTGELTESWEALFFEDSAPSSPNRTDIDRQEQLSSSTDDWESNGNNTSDREGIETIAALTDLFEQMGLTPPAPATQSNSTPDLSSQIPESQTSDPEVSLVEDTYIPASLEEDLLETAILDNEPDLEIPLNPNTLDQLEQDLNRFEQSLGQDEQRQEEQQLPSNYLEELTDTPETPQLDWQNQRFPLPPQELLAEDWEEFVLNQLKAEQGLTDDAIPTASESVESDFDPDLFPSEVLELDRESTVDAAASPSQELPLAGEIIAFEEENVVDEMQWDEPTDSSTEEAIAPEGSTLGAIAQWEETTSFASPQLEFESDFLTREALDSAPESEGSTAMPRALRDEDTQNSMLPQNPLENDSDTLLEAGVNSEQPDNPKTISSDSDSESETHP